MFIMFLSNKKQGRKQQKETCIVESARHGRLKTGCYDNNTRMLFKENKNWAGYITEFTPLNSLLQFLFFLLKWKVCLWYNFCRITKFCCKKKNMVNVMLSLRETVVSLCLLRKRACTSTDFEEELLRMVSCRCFWDLHSCLSFHVFLLNLSLSLSFL